jgi:hypothetical protein
MVIFMRITRFLLFMPIFLCCSIWAAEPPTIKITVESSPKTIYSWENDRCEDEFIPDSPARAFRREDGMVSFIASHRENWMLIGPDLRRLNRDCHSMLRTSKYKNTGVGKLWIQATYTENGRDVAAIVSNDLALEMMKQGCTQTQKDKKCWVNRLLGAQSSDMGKNYEIDANEGKAVATLQTTPELTKDNSKMSGVFSSSNIVKSGKYYFSFFFLQDEQRKQSGNCLFRTSNPFDSASWRGWDGEAFTVNLSSASNKNSCEMVSTKFISSNVRSLSYISSKKVWVAFYRARLKMEGDSEPVPGFYYSTSADLTTWSKGARVMTVPTLPRQDSNSQIMNYPSLIDPDSTSRNFDTVDSNYPWLTYSVHHLKDGKGTMNRDIRYVILKIH